MAAGRIKWVFNIAAIAPTPDLLEADRTWVRSMYDALQPFAAGIGTYVNFLSDADEERVRASYGPEVRAAVPYQGRSTTPRTSSA